MADNETGTINITSQLMESNNKDQDNNYYTPPNTSVNATKTTSQRENESVGYDNRENGHESIDDDEVNDDKEEKSPVRYVGHGNFKHIYDTACERHNNNENSSRRSKKSSYVTNSLSGSIDHDDNDTSSFQSLQSKRLKVSRREPWYKFKDVWMDNVMEDDFNPESKRVNVVLLHVKVNDTMKTKVSIYSGKGTKNFGSSDVNYDRIFLFGSLGTKTCFVIISTSSRMSAHLLTKFTSGEYSVGQTAVLLEPLYQGKTLGKDSNLPIFEVKKSFEPYDFPKIPEILYEAPEEVCTRYFHLKGVLIEVLIAGMQKSNCSGIFCDRQIVDRSCSCLHKTGKSQLVLEGWVKVRDKYTGEIILDMYNFRSWNFTKLILNSINVALTVDDFKGKEEARLRKCIMQIVNYVNRRGGWKVYGWMRRGYQTDASDNHNTRGEEITAESVSPHIIKLYPRCVEKRELEDLQFLYEKRMEMVPLSI